MQITLSLYECRRLYEIIIGKPLPPDLPYDRAANQAWLKLGNDKDFLAKLKEIRKENNSK